MNPYPQAIARDTAPDGLFLPHKRKQSKRVINGTPTTAPVRPATPAPQPLPPTVKRGSILGYCYCIAYGQSTEGARMEYPGAWNREELKSLAYLMPEVIAFLVSEEQRLRQGIGSLRQTIRTIERMIEVKGEQIQEIQNTRRTIEGIRQQCRPR